MEKDGKMSSYSNNPPKIKIIFYLRRLEMTNQKRVSGNRYALNRVWGLVMSIVLCGTYGWADITLKDANYRVEMFAQYQQTLYDGNAKYLTADDSGNVYITHDGSDLMLVASNGNVSVFSDGFNNLQGITWTGGTTYGNNLYVAEVYSQRVLRIDASGNVSTIRSLPEQPLVVEIDRTGNYGNQLYAATRNSTILYSISETGNLSEFLNLSDLTDGDPLDMAFDTTGRYNGYMYLSLFSVTNPDYTGILSVDSAGNVLQYLPGVYWGQFIAFDTTNGQDFGGDLFTGGGSGIKRVTPGGDLSEFLTSDKYIKDFVFGSDGTMYTMEVDAQSSLVTISKISVVPEPASLFLLGFGSYIAMLRRPER